MAKIDCVSSTQVLTEIVLTVLIFLPDIVLPVVVFLTEMGLPVLICPTEMCLAVLTLALLFWYISGCFCGPSFSQESWLSSFTSFVSDEQNCEKASLGEREGFDGQCTKEDYPWDTYKVWNDLDYAAIDALRGT
jgi:hypothetical protein